MDIDRTVHEFIENKDHFILVDLRSPTEYKDSRIPKAINIPIFNDKEREEVGTIYKQIGSQEAKWRAMEIVAPKLPTILGKIKEQKEQGKLPLLYCSRGGMRSQSLAQFAQLSGLTVNRLAGGYRAYRNYVVEQIPLLLPKKAVIIDGMTGTGKTEILHRLKEKGYPVLDLEQYANHKGSIFGTLFGQKPNNQKMFDALLFEDLLNMKGSPYFLMEGESKRIGHAVQPLPLYEKKDEALHIRIEASFSTRLERIFNEYVKDFEHSDPFQKRVEEALRRILKRIKPVELERQLIDLLREKNYREMIRLLIFYYYDPRYENKIKEFSRQSYIVNSDSIFKATAEIETILKKEQLFL